MASMVQAPPTNTSVETQRAIRERPYILEARRDRRAFAMSQQDLNELEL